MKDRSPCTALLSRIRNQRLRDACIKSIGKKCVDLFIYISILFIFQCPNRVYNAWNGPFPMNLNRFRHYLDTYYNPIDYHSYFPFHRYFLYREYIQVELGENVIDQNASNILRVFHGHHAYGKLLYTFHPIRESTFDTSEMSLFVKFAGDDQSDSQRRYTYHFQSFSTKTLRCIVEQLTIPSEEYMYWPEKSLYIKKIEQIYNRNSKVFNRRVIRKCGILIGYLYRPRNEYVLPANSYGHHQFNEEARVFDTASSYTPYLSYVLISVWMYVIWKTMIYPLKHIFIQIGLWRASLHHPVSQQLSELKIDSLKSLDQLLSTTDHENNHYNRLFLVHDTYLIMLMIDLTEKNAKILRRFYEDSPLVIIPMDSIVRIESDRVVFKNNHWYV